MNEPKNKLSRAVELATNISIMIVALIGATVLVKNYLLHAPAPAAVGPPAAARTAGSRELPAGPAEGTKVTVPGVSWEEGDQTIVLALSDHCKYCTESAPFYQKLTRELAERKNVRLVAVFPQEASAGQKYLAGLGVPITEVRQASLDSVGVRGTPTLLIVDKSGAVKQSWVGRLSPEREAEVLNRIKA